MMKSLTFNAENLSDVQIELERELVSLHVAEKDILRAQLLVEELSLRMINQGHAAQVNIQAVKQVFGKIQIRMTAEGMSYNPLVEVADWTEDDADYYAMMILKSNRRLLNWSRKNNFNVVTINVRTESNRQLWLLMAAIIGGIICGVAMKATMSPEAIDLVEKNIIIPIRTMFLNALGTVIAPLIFFSILSGIIGMGAGAGVGKLGSKLVGFFAATTIISTLISLFVAYVIFSGDVPQIGTIPASNQVSAQEFSIIKFIVGIIPANLISPVEHGNLLQLIFLAVLFGSALNALGDKVQMLINFVSNCNEFFMKVIAMILFFMPPIAFFAMMSLVLDTGIDTFMTMGKLFAGQILIGGVMVGVYMLIIFFFGKLSPVPFLKKFSTLLPITFAASSTIAVMPFIMNLSIKKLGVSPKITSFAVPLAVTLNMNGACIYLSSVVIMLLKIYGVALDWHTLALVAVLTLAMSFGAPSIPAAYVICIVTVAAMFGVPPEIAGLLFCMDAICDRICTCANLIGDVAIAVFLGRTENLMDTKAYYA